MVKWWTKRRHEAAVTDAGPQVESARTEIAEMAEQAADRAAATIAAAVGDLKAEIEALFAQARRSAGLAVGPATADDEAAGSYEAGAAPGDECTPRAEVPTGGRGSSNTSAGLDRIVAPLPADPAGPRVR